MTKRKNETYLDFADRELKAAKIIYNHRTEDEAFINIVAYHLQQSVEHALKHRLEMKGINYPKSHDIELLLNLQESDFFPDIYPWAGSITLMESQTRYIKNYRSSLKTVDSIMELTERLIKHIKKEELIAEVNKIPEKRRKIYQEAGISFDHLLLCAEEGWTADELSKGYAICISNGEYDIPGALQVDRIDCLGFFASIADALNQAELDGVAFINDIDGIEKGVYVDTPENREICKEALLKHPELHIENLLPKMSVEYQKFYTEKYIQSKAKLKEKSNETEFVR